MVFHPEHILVPWPDDDVSPHTTPDETLFSTPVSPKASPLSARPQLPASTVIPSCTMHVALPASSNPVNTLTNSTTSNTLKRRHETSNSRAGPLDKWCFLVTAEEARLKRKKMDILHEETMN